MATRRCRGLGARCRIQALRWLEWDEKRIQTEKPAAFPGLIYLLIVNASDIIDEIKTFHQDGIAYRSLARHLTDADVERWSKECGWSRSQLFDEIAKRLALGYSASELSFDFCDMVVTDLFSPVTNTSGLKPQIFWEVYSAFDEGEYHHGNNRDEDPVEAYTRPMIARIVEALGASPAHKPSGLEQ